MWLYFASKGVVLVFLGGGFTLGAFIHALENLTLYCIDVGVMG